MYEMSISLSVLIDCRLKTHLTGRHNTSHFNFIMKSVIFP